MKRSVVLPVLLALPLLLAGCGISIKQSSSAGDGGVFKSTDGGLTWQQKVFVGQENNRTVTIANASIASMTFAPDDSKTIFLTTRESGVYVTRDGGDHWERTGITSGAFPFLAIDPTNPNIIYTASGGTILKSIDGLKTFTSIYVERPGVTVTSLAVDQSDSARVFAGTSAGSVLLSEDFGNTWLITHAFTDAVRQLVSVPSRIGRLYSVQVSTGIQRSDDGGFTWSAANPDPKYAGAVPPNWFNLTPGRPDELAIATNYGIFRSSDAGTTWEPIETVVPFGSTPIQTVAISPATSNIIYFTIGHTIYQSTDEGVTWRTIQSIPTSRPISVVAIDPVTTEILYAGTLRVKK